MGQYYKPIILGNGKVKTTIKAWALSHDYGMGLKLMEHSWMKNEFVGAFESQLIPGAKYYKSRVVWAGDYADEETNSKTNLYSRCSDNKKIYPPNAVLPSEYRFIVNHTKQEYVDKREVISNDGWRIHPLPLLTCEGNGQGGGDYYSSDENNIVGSWARDVISVEKIEPIGFKKICFDLVEC